MKILLIPRGVRYNMFIHMLVVYTCLCPGAGFNMLGAVRGCSLLRPRLGPSVPISSLSVGALGPFCLPHTGASVLL